MLTLWRKQNMRNIRLTASSIGQSVVYVERNGRRRWAYWMGFMAAENARMLRVAKPVRLEIQRIGTDEIRDLAPGEYVQGCLIGEQVWAVFDAEMRIVAGPTEPRWP